MASLFTSFWESGNWTTEWDGEFSGFPDVDSLVTYNGSAFSAYMHDTSVNIGIKDFGSASNNYSMYVRFYLRLKTLGSNSNTIMYFQSGGTGANTAGYLVITALGKLQVYDGADVQVGSDSATLTLNQWYRVEVLADGRSGAGACIMEGRLSGTQFGFANNRTFDSNSMGRITFGEDPADASSHEYFADYFEVDDSAYPVPVGEASATYVGSMLRMFQ